MFTKCFEINPDEDNPWKDDVLDRSKIASFLESNLLTSPTPFVLNLSSPWGTGKSFFIKRWFQQLKNKHFCVYYNAWENDLTKDPILSFIAVIQKAISKYSTKPAINNNVKSVFKTLTQVTLPILFKGYIKTKFGGEAIDKCLGISDTDAQKELYDAMGRGIENVISALSKEEEVLSTFKSTFSEYLNTISKEHSLSLPAIFFIDELDRCRPEYSISLLESIKHIFSTRDIIFILSTDSEQLSNGLKALYGDNINSGAFFRRIIDQEYVLPKPDNRAYIALLFEKFQIESIFMNRIKTPTNLWNSIDIFASFASIFTLSLRDIETIVSRFHAIAKCSRNLCVYVIPVVYLLCCQLRYTTEYYRYCEDHYNTAVFLNIINEKINFQTKNPELCDLNHKYLIYLFNDDVTPSVVINDKILSIVESQAYLRSLIPIKISRKDFIDCLNLAFGLQ